MVPAPKLKLFSRFWKGDGMNSKKILIVEDENIVARDIAYSLKGLGYEISGVARCAEDAVETARANSPDLILMDIMLKGEKDGVDAAQEVRQTMDVPVVYLTACADEKTLNRAKTTEPFGYILKPFEEKELQTAVEMAIFRHQLERQLKENKEWLAATLQCIGHGVIVTDPMGKVALMNPIAEFLTGWDHLEAVGQAFTSIFHLTNELTREKLPNPTHFLAECSAFLTSKDGREIPVVVKVTPNHEGARITGYVISFLDISDRKRLEHLKDEFVSTVSHELRTPMMIIRESISQVLDGIHGETTEKQRNFLSLSLRGIDRLGRIVNDLLDMAKIEAGEVEFQRDLIDFKRLVREAAAGFSIPAKTKGVEIFTLLPKGKMPVYIDKDKMTQVLTNLIGNALKFTDKGSIEISAADLGDRVECKVKDTGRGISREDLPNVFGKFQQFHREAGPGEKGTGLGLSICKGIVELHQGTIKVESEFGKGTEFIFRFPKKTAADVLKEYLKNGVKDAMKQKSALSVLIFRFQPKGSGGGILNSVRKSAFLFRRMEKIIKQALRRKSDQIFKENSSIFVLLLATPEEGGKSVMQRLKVSMDHYLKEHALMDFLSVEPETVTFDPLKSTTEDFLKKFSLILDGMKPDKKENTPSEKLILVVDDEPDTLDLMESRLTANGYKVFRAEDGESALSAIEKSRPDLIVLDWTLSEMDGLTVCKILKSNPLLSKIPVIFFTANAQEIHREMAAQARAEAYMTKPLEPELFLEKVKELLSKEKGKHV